ncbi:MAG: class I adenylate-forming enzyme family protein [Deltaproteobacteria bacterium]|nr:class I adenylate-forming enzyme family protein [Deltaproteobacteria bacterium]
MEKRKLTYSYCQVLGINQTKGRTFGQMLQEMAERYPEHTAIIFQNQQYTYREFQAAVDSFALALFDLGLTRGDKLGLLLPDWPEYSIALYACAKMGVVVSPMNPIYRRMEVLTVLNHLEAKALIIPEEWRDFRFVDLLEEIRSEIPSLRHIIVKGKPGEGMLSFQDLLSQDWQRKFGPGFLEKYLQDHPVEADDLLEIAYTSGTTGRPKGVMETHNTRMLHSVGIAERIKASEKDVWLNMTPLFHTTGNCVVQHTAFLTGGTLILLGRYSTETSLREIERCRATIAAGVPTMFIDLMNHPHFEKTDVSSLRYALFTGAPMPPKVALQIVERFQCGILQGDGTTECGSNVLSLPESPIELIAESPGPPLAVGNEVKVVDPQTNRIVPVGVLGEICHRGPTNFLGYYKDPELTTEAVDEKGWFHSGDLGTMDEGGNLRLKGRIKDMIVRGGENIYATDVESILYTYPKVKECQVVGYPDERLGEKTLACIIPRKAGDRVTREEIYEFMKDKTAKFKIPDQVITLEDFPRTASGKVQKFKLREMAAQKLKGD